MAYLFHASANTWTQIFSIDHAAAPVGWIIAGLLVFVSMIILIVSGPENLSRKTTRVQE